MQPTLRDEVREALIEIIRDPEASPNAKASAARTLMEFFGDDEKGAQGLTSALTEEQLDAEIARLQRQPPDAGSR
jgi:hypothetical protein